MRVCLVYDCLFPHTVGGASGGTERSPSGLQSAGHESPT